jgi:hypothetical protein
MTTELLEEPINGEETTDGETPEVENDDVDLETEDDEDEEKDIDGVSWSTTTRKEETNG